MRRAAGRSAGLLVAAAALLLSMPNPAVSAPVTRTWDGGDPTTGDTWTNGPNWVGDVAPAAGDTLAFPESAAKKTTTNNFGETNFVLFFGGAGYLLNGDTVIVDTGGVTFDTVGFDTVNLPLRLNVDRTVDVAAFGGFLHLAGPVVGPGGLVKKGAGTLVLSAASNSYAGTTTVMAGALRVNGPNATSNAIVNGPTAVLAGIGSTGNVTVAQGGLNPADTGAQGTLSTALVRWDSGAAFDVDLFGGAGNDLLNVTGTVDIDTNAVLRVTVNYVPNGETITIIQNDFGDAVVGNFAGKPEGNVFVAGGYRWRITYGGGTGNDVVLTHLPDTVAAVLVATAPKVVDHEIIDERAFLAFRVDVSGPDTITQVAVDIRMKKGSADTALFDTVALYRDANRNGEFDGGVDTFMGNFAFNGAAGPSWQRAVSVPVAGPPDSVAFVVTALFRPTVLEGETAVARLVAGGVAAAKGGTTPLSPLSSPIHRVKTFPDFMDSTFLTDAFAYPTPETAYLEVEDQSSNLLPGTAETLSVTVTKDTGAPDTETVTLIEIGLDSGVFRAALPISNNPADSTTQNGKIFALPGHVLRVVYALDGTFDTVPIVPPPDTIVLLFPNGGQVLRVGETAVLTWDSGGAIANVDLRYSTDTGASFPNVIASGVPNTGSFAWSVPDSPSRYVRVKVAKAGDTMVTDASDSNLSIVVAFEVTAPDGGEVWTAGSAQTITWFDTGTAANVRIDLSTDSGATFPTNVVASTANTGSYGWTVPGNVGPYARIRVSDAADPNGNDTSNANFRIRGAFAWTAPAGGANFVVGETRTLAWTTTGTVPNVDLHYSTDSGATFPNAIALGVANADSFVWTVPDSVGTTTKVRVRDSSDTPASAQTSGVFNVIPALEITSPDGGEILVAGNTVTITWIETGTVLGVDLRYDTNAGAGGFPGLIATAAPPGGSYAWNVPAAFGTNVRIRINDNDYPAASDSSNADFTITNETAPPSPFALSAPVNGLVDSSGSISFGWTASSDSSPPVTYVIRKANNPSFTGFSDSAAGTSTSGIISGFSTDTWYWRVIASDAYGNTRVVGDSVFFVDVIAPIAGSLSAPADLLDTRVTTIDFAWTAGYDTGTGVAGYRLRLAYDTAFANVYLDTTVGPATLSVTSAVAADTTTYWRVSIRDVAGFQTAFAPDRSLRVDVTPPSAPGLVSPAGNTVVSPVLLDWNASTDTLVGLSSYRVQVATNATFAAPVLDGLQGAPDTTVPLAADTYFWRVIAADAVGNTSASTANTFVVVVPAETVPPAAFSVVAPAGGTETNLASVSFQWNASSDSSLPITYRVQFARGAGFSPLVGDTAVGSVTSVVLGVSPNDTYFWRVVATDAAGNTTVSSNSLSFLVDQTPPSVPVLVDPTAGETKTQNVTLDWNASTDGLSGVGVYRVQVSTDPSFATVSVDGVQSMPDTTLSLAVTTWYWRVFAQDQVGNNSAFSGGETFVVVAPPDTVPPLPVQNLAAATDNAGNVTLTWDRSPSTDMDGGGLYVVLYDSGSGNPTTVLSLVAHYDTQTSYAATFGSPTLIAGTTYAFVVQARDKYGNQNSDTAKVLATPVVTSGAAVHAVFVQPSPGMTILKTTTDVFVAAEVDPLSEVARVTAIRFEYRPDTTNPSAPWTAMAAAAGADSNPSSAVADGAAEIYWDVSSVAVGTYQIRAVAKVDGADDTAAGVITFTLTADQAQADRIDTVVEDGQTVVLDDGRVIESDGSIVQTEQTIYGNTENTVVSGNETTTAEVVFPPDAIDSESDVVEMTIRPCDDTVQGRPDGLPGASMRVDLSLESGDTEFGGILVTVTLSYPDEDQDGLVDGTTLREEDLELWVFSTGVGWQEIPVTSRDPVANKVSGQTSHFSTFLLTGPGATATNLSNVVVAPNPFRPNDGNSATGIEFDGTVGSGISFFNLPEQVRVEIFTITGKRVASITAQSSSGTIQWDVMNEERDRVASGFYIWVVTDLVSGERRTGKLAVIR